MAGRPRTTRAQRLAVSMAADLRGSGPRRIEELLDEGLCGPSDWEAMARWERAASRMATGLLMRQYGARLGCDGRLYLPRQTGRRAA